MNETERAATAAATATARSLSPGRRAWLRFRADRRGFRSLCTRRILVRELELRVHWGLGRARPLFQEPRAQKFERLEPALARLRKRYPATPVQPGWMAAEGCSA